jgi:hypothetical protein
MVVESFMVQAQVVFAKRIEKVVYKHYDLYDITPCEKLALKM